MTTNAPKATKASAKRVRKPRRIMPENPDFIQDGPSELDVVSGRGGGSNHHPGNKRYWEKILAARDTYKNLEKENDDEKTEIAESIMHYIDNSCGRFLQKHKTGRWFVLPPKIVVDKIKQALRDEYVPLFARDRYPYTPKSKKGGENERKRSASPKAKPAPKPVHKEPELPSFPMDLENYLSVGSLDHAFGVKSQPSFFTNFNNFANEIKKSCLSSGASTDSFNPFISSDLQRALNQPSVPSNPFASTDGMKAHIGKLTSLNDLLKSCASTNGMQGDLLKGDLLKSSNFLRSTDSIKAFPSIDLAKTFASGDDLKMETSQLPAFLTETSRSSLNFLNGQSLDMLQSMDNASSSSNPFINPCAVSRARASWMAEYENGVTAV